MSELGYCVYLIRVCCCPTQCNPASAVMLCMALHKVNLPMGSRSMKAESMMSPIPTHHVLWPAWPLMLAGLAARAGWGLLLSTPSSCLVFVSTKRLPPQPSHLSTQINPFEFTFTFHNITNLLYIHEYISVDLCPLHNWCCHTCMFVYAMIHKLEEPRAHNFVMSPALKC